MRYVRDLGVLSCISKKGKPSMLWIVLFKIIVVGEVHFFLFTINSDFDPKFINYLQDINEGARTGR